MKFEDAWNQLCRKQPLLGNPDAEVTIKASQFRRLLQQFYDAGEDKAKAGQRANDFIEKVLGKNNPFGM